MNELVIQHNLNSMFTQRELKTITGEKTKRTEKLSSGYRINRVADDAAGLAISEKMRNQIRGLEKASQNVQDGISFVQVGEGALGEIHDMLQRIRELAVQAANDTNTSSDRKAINNEVSEIKKEMNRVYNTTEFNTKKIFRAPYVPDIEGMPDDFELFNGPDGSTPAGVLINHKRYTWGELDAPTTPRDTDWEKEFEDNGELIRLRVRAGEDATSMHRVYEMTADETGININNLSAGTWDDTIKQDGNTYSFSYHGMDISFEAEPGDSRTDIINKLNGDGISVNSWDAIPRAASAGWAVTSSEDQMVLNVTDANKNAIDSWSYSIVADAAGVGLVQTNGDDGLTHTKMSWEDFSNVNSGEAFPISDWGTEDEGENPVTLDTSASYKYEDRANAGYYTNNMSFQFRFGENEVAKAQTMAGLTQSLWGRISSPISSVTGDAGITVGSNHFSDFYFQRDQLLRSYGSSGSEDPMTLSVERTIVADDTVTDHEHRYELSEAFVKRVDTTEVRDISGPVDTLNVTYYDLNGNVMAQPADGIYDAVANIVTSEIVESESGTNATYIGDDGDLPVLPEGSNTETIGQYTSTRTETRDLTDLSGNKIGSVSIEVQVTHTKEKTTTSSYEKDANGNLLYYGKEGEDYTAKPGAVLYVRDHDEDLPKDTEGNTYREATAADTGAQRYLVTGDDWVETDTYDLSHYKYDGKNSAGTTVMSHTAYDSSMQFLKTGGTEGSITIHDASGNAVTYKTENNGALMSTRLSGGGYNAYVNLTYASGGESTNTLTITPNGPAQETFTKNARTGGTATDTGLTVKVNPPEKLLHIQAGALPWQSIDIRWPALTNSIVGISGADTTTYDNCQATIQMADDSISFISRVRSGFGAMQNRLEYAYNIDRNTQENTQAAESRIRDLDMADEMVNYSKSDIVSQAAMAMLSQANQQPQSVVSLLG